MKWKQQPSRLSIVVINNDDQQALQAVPLANSLLNNRILIFQDKFTRLENLRKKLPNFRNKI